MRRPKFSSKNRPKHSQPRIHSHPKLSPFSSVLIHSLDLVNLSGSTPRCGSRAPRSKWSWGSRTGRPNRVPPVRACPRRSRPAARTLGWGHRRGGRGTWDMGGGIGPGGQSNEGGRRPCEWASARAPAPGTPHPLPPAPKPMNPAAPLHSFCRGSLCPRAGDGDGAGWVFQLPVDTHEVWVGGNQPLGLPDRFHSI